VGIIYAEQVEYMSVEKMQKTHEMHKMAHDMFLVDLQYATRQWKEFGDIKKIINFIAKTPEWIVMYVNSPDVPTADYLPIS